MWKIYCALVLFGKVFYSVLFVWSNEIRCYKNKLESWQSKINRYQIQYLKVIVHNYIKHSVVKSTEVYKKLCDGLLNCWVLGSEFQNLIKCSPSIDKTRLYKLKQTMLAIFVPERLGFSKYKNISLPTFILTKWKSC